MDSWTDGLMSDGQTDGPETKSQRRLRTRRSEDQALNHIRGDVDVVGFVQSQRDEMTELLLQIIA